MKQNLGSDQMSIVNSGTILQKSITAKCKRNRIPFVRRQ